MPVGGTLPERAERDSHMAEITTATPTTPMLLDVHRTAKSLGIGERKLWSLTNCREIRCVRIGRRVLYDPRDLTAYIDGQKRRGDE